MDLYRRRCKGLTIYKYCLLVAFGRCMVFWLTGTVCDESIALLLPRCPPCRAGPPEKGPKGPALPADFDSIFWEVLAARANLTLNA